MKTLEETFIDKISNGYLTDFSENIGNEQQKVEFMKQYETDYYENLEEAKEKKYSCGICGFKNSVEASEINRNGDQKGDLVEGFLGTGPGESKLPEDPLTNDKCCPTCYEAVVVNGKKKCKQVCLHGDYQDYNCLSEEAYKTLIYGDPNANIIGKSRKEGKVEKLVIEKDELQKKLNDPMITVEEKIKIEEKIEIIEEKLEPDIDYTEYLKYVFGVVAGVVTFLVMRKSLSMYTNIVLSLFIGICFGLVYYNVDSMNMSSPLASVIQQTKEKGIKIDDPMGKKRGSTRATGAPTVNVIVQGGLGQGGLGQGAYMGQGGMGQGGNSGGGNFGYPEDEFGYPEDDFGYPEDDFGYDEPPSYDMDPY